MASSIEQIVVSVDSREGGGKNFCRRLRLEGKVPGNVYGMNVDSFAVSVEGRRIEEVLRLESGRNTIITLSLGDGKDSRAVMLRELQRDPVSERLVHVDFMRVDPTKTIHVQVPIHLIGTPVGVKLDEGVVDFVHRQVEVACLPSAIPDHLEVDISHLQINQNIAVKELVVGEGIEILDPPDTILAIVASPRVETEETPAAEEGAEVDEAVEDGEAKTEESKEEGGDK